MALVLASATVIRNQSTANGMKSIPRALFDQSVCVWESEFAVTFNETKCELIAVLPLARHFSARRHCSEADNRTEPREKQASGSENYDNIF